MNPTRLRHRRQLAAAVLLPVVLVLPFTPHYEQNAGLLARCLYVGALLLTLSALALLLAPVADAVARRGPVRPGPRTRAAVGRGTTVLCAAAGATALLLADLALTGLLDPASTR